ncbi:MAG TPA: DUF916 domain-containing protein [Acidimicrobiales bacterium]|nr:DUF916 domain-containing protein [Acidimicrobiales bacterium]
MSGRWPGPLGGRAVPRLGALLVAVLVVAAMWVCGTLIPARAVAQTAGNASLPTPGLATGTPTQHGYFEYRAAPGEKITGSVRVTNPGPGSATFSLYPVDGLTSSATGVVYSARGSTLSSTGTWITLTRTTVSLAAGSSAVVPFLVTVPASPYSGDHVGGIAAENPTAAAAAEQGQGSGSGVALKVQTRVILAVVVTVPGPATAALQVGHPSIAEQNGTQQVVDIPMNDTGELLFKPHLVASVSDCQGAPVAHADRQLDTFVPRTSIVYQWSLAPTILKAGCYNVTATVLNGQTPVSSQTDQVNVTSAVASVKPAGPGARPPSGPAAAGTKTKSISPLLGLVGGAAFALLLLVIAALIFFLIWSRRRDREEESREPAHVI